MISDNQSICPKCGGQLKYYDHVQRLVRTKFGNKVLEGLITCETLGFEDYPCEMTMIRWRLFPPRLFLLTAVPNLK